MKKPGKLVNGLVTGAATTYLVFSGAGCNGKVYKEAKDIPAGYYLEIDDVQALPAGDALCGNFDQGSSIALIKAHGDLNYDGEIKPEERFIFEVTPSLRKVISQEQLIEMAKRFKNAKFVYIPDNYNSGTISGPPENWADGGGRDPGLPRIIHGKIRGSTDFIKVMAEKNLGSVKPGTYQGKGKWKNMKKPDNKKR